MDRGLAGSIARVEEMGSDHPTSLPLGSFCVELELRVAA